MTIYYFYFYPLSWFRRPEDRVEASSKKNNLPKDAQPLIGRAAQNSTCPREELRRSKIIAISTDLNRLGPDGGGGGGGDVCAPPDHIWMSFASVRPSVSVAEKKWENLEGSRKKRVLFLFRLIFPFKLALNSIWHWRREAENQSVVSPSLSFFHSLFLGRIRAGEARFVACSSQIGVSPC